MNLMLKELFRTIKKSMGRFIAIASIIALGVGFYGGLRMACNDMKSISSIYYNNTNLMDLRIVSTFGLSQNNIDALKNLDEVDGVMPSYEADILSSDQENNNKQNTIRLHSLDPSAYDSTNINNEIVQSDNKNFINRPILLEGKWPENPDECIISYKATGVNMQDIGDEITINDCSSDIDKTLNVKKLKIVGFVKSSYYVCTSRLATSTLGKGIIDQYAYVPNSTFKNDLPYTEAFLTVKDAKNYFYNSDKYQNLINNASKKIEEIAPHQAEIRTSEIKKDAQDKIDNAKAEINNNEQKANEEFRQNQYKLDQSYETLEDAKNYITKMENKLDNGFAEYEQQKNIALSKLAAYKQILDYAKETINKLDNNYHENQNSIEYLNSLIVINFVNAQNCLPSLIQTLETSTEICKNILDTTQKNITDKQQLKQITEIVIARQLSINLLKEQSSNFYKKLNEAPLEEKQQIYNDEIKEYNEYYTAVTITNEVFNFAFKTVYEYLENYFNQFYTEEAEVNTQLDNSYNILLDSKKQLKDAKVQLENGNLEYLNSRDLFNKAKTEAYEKLANAKSEIENSQKKIDDIEPATILIMDRSKNFGCISLINDADRIDNISQVFPFIFFLVAALVALTSMTRMVEEERTLIGAYKSLGISNIRIFSKYIIYVLLSGIIGSIIGLLIIPQAIPLVIIIAYTIMYNYPFPNIMPFDISKALIATSMGLGVALIATIGATANILKEVPASILLPKAPKAGKKIIIERISILWKPLSFNWKTALRNIFLYKKRFFMTIIGIAGCCALLLTGFGLSDSINDIIDKQFDYIQYDNFSAVYETNSPESTYQEAIDVAKQNKDETQCTFIHEESLVAIPEGKPECSVLLDVPKNIEQFKQLRKTQTRNKQEILDIENNTVLINEKLSILMNVKVGDTITLYEQDKIGNAGTKSYSFKIGGIFENYIAHYIYMNETTYQNTFGQKPTYNTFIARYISDENSKENFLHNIQSIEHVKMTNFIDQNKESYKKMMSSVDMVVVVLIIFAGILAFVVLYNLTNINICERQREIATLKVLGAKSNEIFFYIHRETIILSLIGALVGIALGFVMENFVILSAEIDYVMFGRNIYAPSIIYSILITLGFTIIVTIFTRKKINNISMVESLKSIE